MQQHAGKDIEVVLERAREEEASARSVEKPPRFRVTKESRVADLDSPVLRVNRRAERRKYSTFNMMLVLFACATAIVIYIGHIISVNHLAVEVDKLSQHYDDLLRTRAKLQAE